MSTLTYYDADTSLLDPCGSAPPGATAATGSGSARAPGSPRQPTAPVPRPHHGRCRGRHRPRRVGSGKLTSYTPSTRARRARSAERSQGDGHLPDDGLRLPADHVAAAVRAGPWAAPALGMGMNSHKHRSVHAAAFAGYRPSTVVTEVLTKPAFGPIPPGSGNATLIAAIRVVDRAAHGRDPGRKIVPGVAEGIGQ
jgi:hypothetical protein